MDSGVYIIRNIINNHVYIGSASNISSRWQHHKWTANHNRHRNPHFQRAWNKYGEQSFIFNILELIVGSRMKIFSREQYWIDEYIKDGYTIYNCREEVMSSMTDEQRHCYTHQIRNAWNKGKTMENSKRSNFTEKQKQAMYILYKNGFLYEDIAVSFNYNREGVRILLTQYIIDNQLSFRNIVGNQKMFDDETIQEIFNLWYSGVSYKQLANYYECSDSTIKRVVKQYRKDV
jgi:group I intron endonuclease